MCWKISVFVNVFVAQVCAKWVGTQHNLSREMVFPYPLISSIHTDSKGPFLAGRQVARGTTVCKPWMSGQAYCCLLVMGGVSPSEERAPTTAEWKGLEVFICH